MKFVFEVKTENVDNDTQNLLRKNMLGFEHFINLTIPKVRVHLKEETE